MPPLAIGGMLVSPISTAPAPRSRSMTNASRWATRFAKAGLPAAARQTAGQVAVLRGVRDAVERPERLAGGPPRVGRLGVGARLGVGHHDGVQRAVVGGDAGEVRLEQRHRRDLTAGQRGAQVGDGRFVNLESMNHPGRRSVQNLVME